MPDLPTLTVTQAQADRMLAAYGDVATYKAWLREQIINYVVASEYSRDYRNFVDTAEVRRNLTHQELSP